MGKCPYCGADLHLEDFYESMELVTKKGVHKLRVTGFKGDKSDFYPWTKMWVCPSCNTILGFSEFGAGGID